MKMTHHGMMVRVLVAALAAGCALPAFAQDDQRWRDRQGERGDSESDAEREQLRQQRQERREARAAEAQARGEAAQQQQQQQAPRQERQAYDPEAQRRQVYERAADPNQQPRADQRDRRRAEQRDQQQQQQQVQLQRDQQMRQDEARRVEQQRQERYGYGDARDGSRNWDDGNRRGDQGGRDGGNDRDRNRDRDGRGDRDWDRDGRGGRDERYGRNDRDGRRWDNDSQRRWDGWQRDADRYRREAMQRHNANRYAALQQQRRMSQYRYQQDYWERSRRWHSGWNSRRYDRNFVIAPIVYRYSRGGRWYDVNRYAADTLQEAIRIGYSEGARAGDADRMDGWRGGYRDNFVYQDADFGYDGYYVALPEYQYYFREGFRRGYEDAYGRRYRYGRHSNGDWIIAAATLGLILNLQDY